MLAMIVLVLPVRIDDRLDATSVDRSKNLLLARRRSRESHTEAATVILLDLNTIQRRPHFSLESSTVIIAYLPSLRLPGPFRLA